MTLEEFRRLTADLPGELVLAAFTTEGYCPVTEVTDQASDAVPGPAGTDPMTQDTVGVLLLDIAEFTESVEAMAAAAQRAVPGARVSREAVRASMQRYLAVRTREHEDIAALRDANFDLLAREVLVASIRYLAEIIVGPA